MLKWVFKCAGWPSQGVNSDPWATRSLQLHWSRDLWEAIFWREGKEGGKRGGPDNDGHRLCRSRRQGGLSQRRVQIHPPRPSAPQLRLPAPTPDTIYPRRVSTRPHPVSPTENTWCLHPATQWGVFSVSCSSSCLLGVIQSRAERPTWRGLTPNTDTTCANNMAQVVSVSIDKTFSAVL